MTITDTPTPTDDGTLVLSISDAALGTVLGIRDQEDDAEALGLRVDREKRGTRFFDEQQDQPDRPDPFCGKSGDQ